MFPHGGVADLVGIDPAGELLIAEFKKGPENPDSRSAVAQVIEYGSALWRAEYKELDRLVVGYLRSDYCVDEFRGKDSLVDAMEHFVGTDPSWDANLFRDAVSKNLESGRFNFAIVAREIPETLKGSIEYLTNVAGVNIFGVEVDYFRSEGTEIFIPRCVNTMQPSRRKGSIGMTTRPEFMAKCDDDGKRVFSRVLEWMEENGHEPVWRASVFTLQIQYGNRNLSVLSAYPPGSFHQCLYTQYNDFYDYSFDTKIIDQLRDSMLTGGLARKTKTALIADIDEAYTDEMVERYLEVIGSFIAKVQDAR